VKSSDTLCFRSSGFRAAASAASRYRYSSPLGGTRRPGITKKGLKRISSPAPGLVPDEVGRLREARLSPASRPGLLRERRTPSVPVLQRGFTYIGMLIFIAILGIGLAASGVVFHQQAQREKEKELLFVGDQIRQAIAQYYEKSPGGNKRFPEALEDLLLDQRYPAMQRYLRRVYKDPMARLKDWELVRAPDGGIIGVYSSSKEQPLKMDNFPAGYDDFKDGKSYVDWKFVYAVPDEKPATPQSAPGNEGSAAPPQGAKPVSPGAMPGPGVPAKK
jgi:type II secretory pathway pseudopilin PulG